MRLNRIIFILLSAFSFQLYSPLANLPIFLAEAHAESDIAAVEKPFLEGKYDKAVYEAGRLIDARARQRDEIYYLKGLSELKLNRFKDARQSFDAIISKYRNSNRVFDANVGIGDSYLLEGNNEGAVRVYNEIKEKFSSHKNIALVDSRLAECRQKTPSPISTAAVEDKPEPAAAPVEAPKGSISVQAGCFKSERNANALSAKLIARGYKSYVELPVVAGDRLYRVKVGRVSSKDEAESLAAKLKRDGYKTKICDDNSCR